MIFFNKIKSCCINMITIDSYHYQEFSSPRPEFCISNNWILLIEWLNSNFSILNTLPNTFYTWTKQIKFSYEAKKIHLLKSICLIRYLDQLLQLDTILHVKFTFIMITTFTFVILIQIVICNVISLNSIYLLIIIYILYILLFTAHIISFISQNNNKL